MLYCTRTHKRTRTHSTHSTYITNECRRQHTYYLYLHGRFTRENFIPRVFQLIPPTMTALTFVFWVFFCCCYCCCCCVSFNMYTVWSHKHTHTCNGNNKTVDLLFKNEEEKKRMKSYSISTSRSLVYFFGHIII